jgi:hypothetical protein
VGPGVQSPVQTELAGWQTDILRLWSANIGRSASKTDILFFRGVLEANEDAISARLQVLSNENQRIGSFRGVPRICNEGSYSWMHNPYSVITQPSEGLKADERTTSSFNKMQLKGHPPILLPLPNASAEAYDPTDVTGQELHNDNSHAKDVLQLDTINAPTPVLPTSSSRGKQRQVENTVSGSLTASHALVWPSSTRGLDIPGIPWRRVRELIGHVIHKKAAEGCGSIRGHESQQGMFPCSLGCGRRFKSSADTFRHEEIVYPQNFWFCLTCGDPNKPDENHLFTRKDKMRQHIKRLNHSIDISHCRIPHVRTLYPEICGFCSNHRHPNWKERCKHLIRHCRKGDFATNARSRGTGQIQDPTNGNDDEDEDDDDDDADSDESPQDEPDERNEDGDGGASNGEGPSDPEPKRNAGGYDPGQFATSADNDDDIFGSFLMDSPGLYGFTPFIRDAVLHSDVNRKHKASAKVQGATICPHCAKSFTGSYQRGNYARHVRQQHSEENATQFNINSVCHICGQQFKRQDARRKHEWNKHNLPDTKPVPRQSPMVLKGLESLKDEMVSTVVAALVDGKESLVPLQAAIRGAPAVTKSGEFRCVCEQRFKLIKDFRRHPKSDQGICPDTQNPFSCYHDSMIDLVSRRLLLPDPSTRSSLQELNAHSGNTSKPYHTSLQCYRPDQKGCQSGAHGVETAVQFQAILAELTDTYEQTPARGDFIPGNTLVGHDRGRLINDENENAIWGVRQSLHRTATPHHKDSWIVQNNMAKPISGLRIERVLESRWNQTHYLAGQSRTATLSSTDRHKDAAHLRIPQDPTLQNAIAGRECHMRSLSRRLLPKSQYHESFNDRGYPPVKIDRGYRMCSREEAKSFFVKGRVFAMLWTETVSSTLQEARCGTGNGATTALRFEKARGFNSKHSCDSTQYMDFEALMNIWGTRDIPRNAILILVVLEPCPDTERQATYNHHPVKHGRIHKHSERKFPLKLRTTGQRSRSVRMFRIWNCMLFSSESGTDSEGAASSRC